MSNIRLFKKFFIFFYLFTMTLNFISAHVYKIQVIGNPENKKVIVKLFDCHSLGTEKHNLDELKSFQESFEAIEKKAIPTKFLLEAPLFDSINIKDKESLENFYKRAEFFYDTPREQFHETGSSANPATIINAQEVGFNSNLGWGLPYWMLRNLQASEFTSMDNVDSLYDFHLFVKKVKNIMIDNNEELEIADLPTFGSLYDMVDTILERSKKDLSHTENEKLFKLLAPFAQQLINDIHFIFGNNDEFENQCLDWELTRNNLNYFFQKHPNKEFTPETFVRSQIQFFKTETNFTYLSKALKNNAESKIVVIAGGLHLEETRSIEQEMDYEVLHEFGFDTNNILDILDDNYNNNATYHIELDEIAKTMIDARMKKYLSITNEEIWNEYYSSKKDSKKRSTSQKSPTNSPIKRK